MSKNVKGRCFLLSDRELTFSHAEPEIWRLKLNLLRYRYYQEFKILRVEIHAVFSRLYVLLIKNYKVIDSLTDAAKNHN